MGRGGVLGFVGVEQARNRIQWQIRHQGAQASEPQCFGTPQGSA